MRTGKRDSVIEGFGTGITGLPIVPPDLYSRGGFKSVPAGCGSDALEDQKEGYQGPGFPEPTPLCDDRQTGYVTAPAEGDIQPGASGVSQELKNNRAVARAPPEF